MLKDQVKSIVSIIIIVFLLGLFPSCVSRNKENNDNENTTPIVEIDIEEPYVNPHKILVGPEGYPDLLGWFLTEYDQTEINRSENLRIAAVRINDVVVQPNQVFSFGAAISPITLASGYKMGIVYSGGRQIPGLAGGVCQVLGTLYNALLYANMTIVERRPHQFMVTYLDNPRDATLFYPNVDFKFRNNRSTPILIKSTVEDGISVAHIFGTRDPDDYEVELFTQITNTIPYTTQVTDDATLPRGERVVDFKGIAGGTAELYVILKRDGEEVSRTLRSRDNYIPHPQVERIGTRD